VAWQPNGDLIATGAADGRVKLWSARTGGEVFAAGGHGGPAFVAWAPRGDRLASAGADARLRLWSARGGPPDVYRLAGKALAVNWSADGARLAVAVEDEPAQVLSAAGGQEVMRLPEAASSLAWSPDGDKIATVHGPRGALLWKASDGTRLFSLEARNDNPSVPSTLAVAWSPDSKRLGGVVQQRQRRHGGTSAGGSRLGPT
jgi:WD40 repeat protein